MLSDEIKEILADILEISADGIDTQARLEELGLDEDTAAQLAGGIEDQYSIEVTEEALDTLKTVEDLIVYVESNLD